LTSPHPFKETSGWSGAPYLSAESISMCLAVQAEHTHNEINDEVPELEAA
jgi:hypothetical protein